MAADPEAKQRCLRWIAQDTETRLAWPGISGSNAEEYRQAVTALAEE